MTNNTIKAVAFDADDTLWVNENHYRNAENKFAQKMAAFCDNKTAINALLERERKNLPLLGYGSKPFIISLVECGIELSKGTLTNNQILELIQIGKDTIGNKIELYPNVENVLEQLHPNIPLVLATKGDLKEQESKVKRSGLDKYFCHIEIMSEKNQESYTKLIDRLGITPDNFVMVGNSFKSDILPVLELGGHAIYIPSEIIWAHEVTQEIEHPRLCKANNIESVPTLLNLK